MGTVDSMAASDRLIDTSFDVRSDAVGRDPTSYRDPDKYSPTLRRYHSLLWSKQLPCGSYFQLIEEPQNYGLRHKSELGEFFLTSDTVIPTYTKWKSMQHIIRSFPDEKTQSFRTLGFTIGGMMIFPGNRIDGRQTINGARGFNRKIADRFDLTLEAIRRHYAGEISPLSEVLSRYASYFELFVDFPGFVEYFLLGDLVELGAGKVRFFIDFDGYQSSPVPKDENEYERYLLAATEFLNARNDRISAWRP